MRSLRTELRALAAVVAAYAAIRAFGLLVLQGAAGSDAFEKLRAWDGEWFIRIATEGYPDELVLITVRDDSTGGLAFFPAYPMLMRALGAVGFDAFAAGLAVTLVAGIAAAIGVYAVAREVLSPRAAALSVVLWAALPMSIVLSMVYSEALFTAFAAWALWAAVRRRWITAGLLGFAAGMTRSVGIAVGIAVLVAAVIAWRRGHRSWRSVVGSVLALAGVPTWWVIVAVISASYAYSFAEVVKYYGIPWLLVTHWCECLSFHSGHSNPFGRSYRCVLHPMSFTHPISPTPLPLALAALHLSLSSTIPPTLTLYEPSLTRILSYTLTDASHSHHDHLPPPH